MSRRELRRSMAVLAVLVCGAVLWGLASPAAAQQGPWPMPQVVLDVHPNERGPGSGTPKIGVAPWTRTAAGPVASYWWHDYKFAASGILWVQVCAQNWSARQTGVGDDDDMRVTINGVIPNDYDGIQNGPAGSYQWDGNQEAGERWTLRFLCLWGVPGLQTIRVAADEQPVLWWVRVTDLEEHMIYPEQ